MMKKQLFMAAAALVAATSCQKENTYTQVYTTEAQNWVSEVVAVDAAAKTNTVEVLKDAKGQTIEGFGACFNELGWTSLSELSAEDRNSIMHELFEPNFGANFTICRMPVAANDFARDWYSYNETDGDFEMKNFSIENDEETLIPFIKEAQKLNPEIKIWASPWCPPSWMKHNKHYASRSFTMQGKDIYGNDFSNGLSKENEGQEGTDMFITEAEYLDAYGLYFEKFIQGYRLQGIDIFGVMPQNEFNSPQTFPSCCWTAKGLATFVGEYLGPRMDKLGVEVMLGTMERPNYMLLDTVLKDDKAGKFITAAGFQWAGKDAVKDIRKNYPDLKLMQTEQECGDGKNDWAGFVHSWGLMKHYLSNGISIYDYWNISLNEGGVSRWGWKQNSLVVVDKEAKSFKYTLEYYLMKHFSHYVKPGAVYMPTSGSTDDVLVFRNTDGSTVVVAAELGEANSTLNLTIDGKAYSFNLKAGSVNTFVL